MARICVALIRPARLLLTHALLLLPSSLKQANSALLSLVLKGPTEMHLPNHASHAILNVRNVLVLLQRNAFLVLAINISPPFLSLEAV